MWSLEQISHRLRVDFPDDGTMRISHEAIYQSLFIEGRGALKRELVTCLRTGRALRQPRARSRSKPQGHVTADVVLSERPAEAEVRSVPGRWEGDLIIGTGRSAIGTLIERSSRSTLLVHLPRLEGWGEQPPVKNAPWPGGHGAIAMNATLTVSMTKLPERLRKTLTSDRGKELSAHAQFALSTGTRVFFADPHSPWQRPTNENTNGLLEWSPKGTDLSRWSAEAINALYKTELIRQQGPWRTVEQVELATLEWVWWWNNQRLHSELGYRTPTEVEAAYYAGLETPETANAALEKHEELNPVRFKLEGGLAELQCGSFL